MNLSQSTIPKIHEAAGREHIALSSRQLRGWAEYFDSTRTACRGLTAQITATDRQIDRMVYDWYVQTEE